MGYCLSLGLGFLVSLVVPYIYLYLYMYLYLTLYHDMYPYTLDLKDTFYLYHYLYLCVWWSYKFTICLLNLAKGFPHLLKKK